MPWWTDCNATQGVAKPKRSRRRAWNFRRYSLSLPSVKHALAFVVLALIPTSARADQLVATREQELTEVSHAVTVRIENGVARYRVRRTFANDGEQAEQAELRLDLAHGAAITGLRIRARHRWFDGVLMERDEARAKYEELTGIGVNDPKDPALLEWIWASQASLRVFPVLPRSVNTVEYTLTAPLEYANGRYVMSYPRFEEQSPSQTRPLAVPVITIEPGYGDAMTEIIVGGQRVAPGSPVVLNAVSAPKWIGDGEAQDGVGYAFSSLEVERKENVRAARVELEVDHTYKGDLLVELVAPDGARFEVERASGSDNDLRGKFDVAFGDERPAAGTWSLVVSDHAALDVGTLDAWSLELTPAKKSSRPIAVVATGLPLFIPDASDGEGSGGHARIEIEPPTFRTLAARLGRVVASKDDGFARLEVDAAPKLSRIPRRASVVFVVDVSYSVPTETIDEQIQVAASYLEHTPDASVEVIVFDRKARRLFGEFIPAADFADAITKARIVSALDRGNGSAVDLGLAQAAKILEGRRGPARIVAMTDAMLRTRFTHAMAAKALAPAPRRTITHLALPSNRGEAELERDDEHDLAPIAAAHGGVLYRVSAPVDEKAGSLRRAMLPLVRPIAIDQFAVRGIDLSDAREVPDALGEGTGYRAMMSMASPPSRVVVTGKIWARDVRRVVRSDREFDAATAAFVFSEDEHYGLSEGEMLKVAFKGRAVSPVTSYLAVEPGVRPSTDGFEESGFGSGGGGLMGHGAGGGGFGRTSSPPLEDFLDPAVRRCEQRVSPAAGWRIALNVETTEREIVDVTLGGTTDPKLAACVVEEIWLTRLPVDTWPPHETYVLHFD